MIVEIYLFTTIELTLAEHFFKATVAIIAGSLSMIPVPSATSVKYPTKRSGCPRDEND